MFLICPSVYAYVRACMCACAKAFYDQLLSASSLRVLLLVTL